MRLAWIIAVATTLVYPAPANVDNALPGLSSVLGELRKGGYVIYFRHSLTDLDGPTDESADLAKCETQRNLTAEGREQATRIGKAFQALRIAVGTVTSSPLCRCKDTAMLAFGRYTVSNDVYVSVGAEAGETKRLAHSLQRMLSTPPAKATNTVIISHMSNLRDATGIWPKSEGVAHVFRPLPGGRFEAIALILPDEWSRVAKLESARK